MFEEVIIGLLFLTALAYLGVRVWKGLSTKKAGCSKGCGCSDSVRVDELISSDREGRRSGKASAL